MKKILIAFLLITSSVFGQTHQLEIVNFIDNNLGKKVGRGVCFEFVEEAINSFDSTMIESDSLGNLTIEGENIEIQDAEAGDIIIFSGGTKKPLSHIGFVRGFHDDAGMIIAEQNVSGGLDKSVVVLRKLDLEGMKEYYGEISLSFYRPK